MMGRKNEKVVVMELVEYEGGKAWIDTGLDPAGAVEARKMMADARFEDATLRVMRIVEEVTVRVERVERVELVSEDLPWDAPAESGDAGEDD